MKMVMIWRGSLAAILALWVGLLGTIPRAALAELVSTSTVIEENRVSPGPRQRMDDLLQREDVRAQFRSLGVSLEEAQRRVSALSDAEIAQLDARLQELPAGESFAGAVLGAILVVLLVLLVTDLLGFTDVFPFIHPLPRGNSTAR